MTKEEKEAYYILRRKFGDALYLLVYVEYSRCPQLQKNGVDFIAIMKNGKVFFIDDKTRTFNVSDVCIEVEKVNGLYHPKRKITDLILYRPLNSEPMLIDIGTFDLMWYQNTAWQKLVKKNKNDSGFCAYINYAEYKEKLDTLLGLQYVSPILEAERSMSIEVSYFH